MRGSPCGRGTRSTRPTHTHGSAPRGTPKLVLRIVSRRGLPPSSQGLILTYPYNWILVTTPRGEFVARVLVRKRYEVSTRPTHTHGRAPRGTSKLVGRRASCGAPPPSSHYPILTYPYNWIVEPMPRGESHARSFVRRRCGVQASHIPLGQVAARRHA